MRVEASERENGILWLGFVFGVLVVDGGCLLFGDTVCVCVAQF